MFYTGIITSLLPYILLIGVCGTLLWNNTFHDHHPKEAPCHTQKSHPSATASYHAEKNCCFADYTKNNHHGTPYKHALPIPHRNWQPPDPGNPIHWQHLHHIWSHDKQAGLNQTFSFRGPPLFS